MENKSYNKRCINKCGLGYCCGCGELTKFTREKHDFELWWVCQKCKYKNKKIYDHNYKKLK